MGITARTSVDLGRRERASAYMLDSPSKLYDAAPAFPAKEKSDGPAKEQRETPMAGTEFMADQLDPHCRSLRQCNSPRCLGPGA